VLGLAPTWPQAAAFLPKPGEDDFDWEGDTPLELPMEDLVIYEMHVRGEFVDKKMNARVCSSSFRRIVRCEYNQQVRWYMQACIADWTAVKVWV
jgi:hypothetical protein